MSILAWIGGVTLLLGALWAADQYFNWLPWRLTVVRK